MKYKMLKMLPVAAGVAVALAAAQASALEFHGYMRAETGSNSEKGSLACFALPGAYSKYRLGNECNDYVEWQLDHNMYEGKDGVKFDYHGTLGFQHKVFQEGDYQAFGSLDSTSNNNNQIFTRQNWIEAKNLPYFNGGSAWVGKRFYQRNDVHITDFYYDGSAGYGGGIEHIKLGDSGMDLSAAWFRNANSSIDSDSRFDVRLGNIPTNPDGNLLIAAQYVQKDTQLANRRNGYTLMLQHFQGKLLGGFNKVAFQYIDGAGAADFTNPNTTASSSHKLYRLVEQLQWQTSPDFSGLATFVYQDDKGSDTTSDPGYKWISYGARGVWHVTDYFKLQLEAGHDEVHARDGSGTRKLDKIAFAPTLVAGRGFWTRPELRVFATYAKWNDAARDNWGGIGNGEGVSDNQIFGNKTSGMSYGVMAESWW